MSVGSETQFSKLPRIFLNKYDVVWLFHLVQPPEGIDYCSVDQQIRDHDNR